MSFEEFQRILPVYHQKKKEGLLSINMRRPTPGRIKEECLLVLKEQFDHRIDRILRQFVGQKENADEYSSAIKTLDADVFKPLSNLLKGVSNSTEDKNIELLAWLIDFRNERTRKPPIRWLLKIWLYRPKKIFVLSKAYALGFVFTILPGTGYIAYKYFSMSQCMYWDKTQYKLVACDDKSKTTPVVKRDNEQLSGFRLITDIESYRPHFLGRVWFVKVGPDTHEYYTDSAAHPTNPLKKLKPITVYHINQYLNPVNTNVMKTVQVVN